MKKICRIFCGVGANQFGEGLNPLRGAQNDVIALSDVFEKAGWYAHRNNGQDKDHLRKDIIGLHNQVNWQEGSEVTICFFFATHGLIRDNESFLVPAGTSRHGYDRMINTRELTEWVELCIRGFDRCKVRCLFIVDACREDVQRGSGDVSEAEVSDSVYRGLSSKLESIQGLNPIFWYSCSQDSGGMAQEIIRESGYRGLFSFELEEVLRDGFKGNLKNLTDQVNEKVRQTSHMHQQPVVANVAEINAFEFDFSKLKQDVGSKQQVVSGEYEQSKQEAERLFSMKEYGRAIDVFGKTFELTSLKSEKHDLLIWKGRALKHKKSYEAALRCFEEALQYTEKEDFETWYHIGSTKRLCGQLNEAENILAGLLGRDGNHPYVLFNLGRLADTYGNTQYAIEYYEAVLKNDPRFEFRNSIKRDLIRLKKKVRTEKKKLQAKRSAENRRKVREALAVFRPAAIGDVIMPVVKRIPGAFFSGLFIFILAAGLVIGCTGIYKLYFAGRSGKAEIDKGSQALFLTVAPEGGDPSAAKWVAVNSRWVRNHYSDGAVTMSDTATGLMWVYDADENGKAFWNAANDRCETMHYAGYDDWRLPDKNELSTLYLHKDLFKDVKDSIWDSFPGAPAYWTSSIEYDEYLRKYDDNYKYMIKMGDHGNADTGWYQGENQWIWPCRKQK